MTKKSTMGVARGQFVANNAEMKTFITSPLGVAAVMNVHRMAREGGERPESEADACQWEGDVWSISRVDTPRHVVVDNEGGEGGFEFTLHENRGSSD